MSDTMRDAFEAWYATTTTEPGMEWPSGYYEKSENGEYTHSWMRHMWKGWQAAQSQPVPPAPADVHEITRLIQPYVAACLKFNYTPMELIEQAEADVNEAFKPIEAALTALVEKNHELQFSLDGVNAMRRPLSDDLVRKAYRSVFDENAPRIYGIAERFARAIEKAHGIEPEQGGKHD